MTDQAEESVKVLSGVPRIPYTWNPVVGPEAVNMLARLRLGDHEKSVIRQEAVSILGHCIPPSNPEGKVTCLAVGFIQSGKTTSFAAVTALARDNGYRLVILIAGTSVPLFNQSEERLKDSLDLRKRLDRKWLVFSNAAEHDRARIQATLDDWKDSSVPEAEWQTVLAVVMKNHSRLRHLNRLLSQLDLRGVPTLVIDDEADQAGLNTAVNQADMSATYRQLVELRSRLPHHSYLQYTATPQAPLLINLIDILSPNFTELLTPGAEYVGGRTFFFDQMTDLIGLIPDAEVTDDSSDHLDPPPSLLGALRIFYLGVAAGLLEPPESRGNRSMMVHPSQYTAKHADYKRWVDLTHDLWAQTLKDHEDADRPALVGRFQESYDELRRTVPSLAPFDKLLEVLPRAIAQTSITEVNAVRGKTPQVDWRGTYAHILVGGQAMDRGFTVEGLTVTYMPRSVGVGNADTLEQRARFLGYKRSYLGYCRVYLDRGAYDAYRAYVDHETDIHRQLAAHRATGKPLSEWKRSFLLDSALKPTRNQVLDIPWIRGDFSDEWYAPRAPHDSIEAVDHNRGVVDLFLKGLRFSPDTGHPDRTSIMRHGVVTVPLANVLEHLLVPLRVPRPSDSVRYYGLLLQIERHLEANPTALCEVYHMSNGAPRMRTLNEEDEVPNLFQGANPADGSIYPGDREMHAREMVTVQVHSLRVERAGALVAEPVPAVTVWVPHSLSAAWISQPQGGRQ